MQYVKALVHKGPDMKIPVSVLPWEIKVLEVKYEEVEIQGTVDGVDREVDAAAEYARLQAKHGVSDDTRIPYVTIAYGQEHESKLAQAIESALAGSEADEPAEAVDLDGDGDVERHEIKVQLDELGVEYNDRAQTKTLRKLLDETLASAGGGGEEDPAT